MRKSFNGLIAIVRSELAADPLADHLFVFLNRNHTLMKILYLSVPLPHTEYRCLAYCASTLIQFLTGMLVLFESAKIHFVHFDNTGQDQGTFASIRKLKVPLQAVVFRVLSS